MQSAELPNALLALAVSSVARVRPRTDRPAYLSTLAAECARTGQGRLSSELFEEARRNLDSGGHPVLRPAGLISIATALHDCGRTPEALAVSQEANALLAAWEDPSASTAEAMLSLFYARIGEFAAAKAIADRIENRGGLLDGLSRHVTMSSAFRAYVGLNDFIAASQAMDRGDLGETENTLLCSVLDLWREARVTEATRARAQWLARKGDRWAVALAALMLWWSRMDVGHEISDLWLRVGAKLSRAGGEAEPIMAASVASLALRRAGRVRDADSLVERLAGRSAEVSTGTLDPLSREYLARALAAFGDVQSAQRISLSSAVHGDVNVAEGVIWEFVDAGKWMDALGLVEASDQQTLPRLVFSLALKLLKPRNGSAVVELEHVRRLRLKLDASQAGR